MNEARHTKRGAFPSSWLPPIRSGFIILLIWCILSYGEFVRPFFLPKPHQVVSSFYFLFTERSFLFDIGASLFRISLGFILSVLLAIPLGVLMGTNYHIRRHIEPVISAMRYIPAVALIPLCILWFGIGETEKIIVIILGTFFQLTILAADAVSQVPRAYQEVAVTLGASPFEKVWHVMVPAASPVIFDACRVTFGWAWTYLVVAEIVGATYGIGHTIIESQRFLRTDQVFAAIMTIGLLGVIADLSMIASHRLLFRWANGKMSA